MASGRSKEQWAQLWTGDGLITFADVLGRGRTGGDSDGPWLPFTRFLPQGREVHPAHQLIGDPGEAVPRWLSESHQASLSLIMLDSPAAPWSSPQSSINDIHLPYGSFPRFDAFPSYTIGPPSIF